MIEPNIGIKTFINIHAGVKSFPTLSSTERSIPTHVIEFFNYNVYYGLDY